jgi:TonB family protein
MSSRLIFWAVALCGLVAHPDGHAWARQTTESQTHSENSSSGKSGTDIQELKGIDLLEPTYPKEAREKNIEGVVAVSLTVGIDGRVKNVSLISGDPLLASAAINTVHQWTFMPKRVDGIPVEADAPACLTFHLSPVSNDGNKNSACPERSFQPNFVSPRILTQAPPVYSAQARHQHIEGEVVLRGFISVDGSLKNLEVVSGDPMLVTSALEAARKWRYSAALKDGKPVEVTTTIRLTFRLPSLH